MKPVPHAEVPDYYDIIKYPMGMLFFSLKFHIYSFSPLSNEMHFPKLRSGVLCELCKAALLLSLLRNRPECFKRFEALSFKTGIIIIPNNVHYENPSRWLLMSVRQQTEIKVPENKY